MGDTAIRIDSLSKRYRLGVQANGGGMYRYKSLRDSFGYIAKDPLKTLKDAVIKSPMDDVNSFWALKDVNFEVKKGEVVGIIGRNGAGKSTLLKILSQITKPTTGRVDLFGRVGSLLEVGTGFHPELTGRENIFLNGAILGMTRAEVKSRFDEIVAFSEIEKFLDIPVKQYSSGMYTRLAFAVAAHLEPEILVVDEVLAVGDGEFQKKCLGKMKDIAGKGRTVLFVSHNIGMIRSLCDTAVHLALGRISCTGDVFGVTDEYLRPAILSRDGAGSKPQNGLRLEEAKITDRDGFERSDFLFTDGIHLNLSFSATVTHKGCSLWLKFFRSDGNLASSACSSEEGFGWHEMGNTLLKLSLKPECLLPGEYTVDLQVSRCNQPPVYFQEHALRFSIHPAPILHAVAPYNPTHGFCRAVEIMELETR